MFEKLSDLKEENHPLAENLDAQLLRGCKYAAKQCHNTRTEPWSPKLHNARLRLQIFKNTLTQLKTKIDMTTTIQQLQAKLPTNIAIPLTETAIKISIEQQKKEIKELHKNAPKNRDDHLQERIIQAAVDNNNKAEKIL